MSLTSGEQPNSASLERDIRFSDHQSIEPCGALNNQRRAGAPILMYHRIAVDGPADLERFRVDPILFDEQLAALQQAGYRTISLSDWIGALSKSEVIPGHPILITFDDGYKDFSKAALPVLRRYSSMATVYLVAGRIGGFADWDLKYGEAAPLMSWQELLELGNQIELGCHSLIHRPLTEISHADLATDINLAREILEEGLGQPVIHFAYPYGAENSSVRSVIATAGFVSAVSCRAGISELGDDPISLPRIDVAGGCTPEELIFQLNS